MKYCGQKPLEIQTSACWGLTYWGSGADGNRDKDLDGQYGQEISSGVLTYRSLYGRDQLAVLPRVREADDSHEREDI